MTRSWPTVLAALALSVAGVTGIQPAHATTGPSRPITWLAAGDSYSSGQGLPIVTGGCAQPGRAGEHVWAQYAAQQPGMPPLAAPPKLVACTNAKTGEFFTPQDSNPAEWTPGMGRYDLVTFTFGGDDVNFADVVTQCVGGARLEQLLWSAVLAPAPSPVNPKPSDPGHTCPSDTSLRQTIASNVGDHYQQFLTKVANDAVTPGGNIVVLGYPEVVELPQFWPWWEQHAGTCYGIGTRDATELRGLAGDLNATIGQAVAAVNRAAPNGVHVHFADVNSGGNGISPTDRNLFEPTTGARHNLCSGDSWINGISLKNLSNSFHPNQDGQQAEGTLAAEVIGHDLDWSGLAPRPAITATVTSLPGDCGTTPIISGLQAMVDILPGDSCATALAVVQDFYHQLETVGAYPYTPGSAANSCGAEHCTYLPGNAVLSGPGQQWDCRYDYPVQTHYADCVLLAYDADGQHTWDEPTAKPISIDIPLQAPPGPIPPCDPNLLANAVAATRDLDGTYLTSHDCYDGYATATVTDGVNTAVVAFSASHGRWIAKPLGTDLSEENLLSINVPVVAVRGLIAAQQHNIEHIRI